jgi:hypothetical protein
LNGRVIFFPLKHCPPQEKLDELRRLNEALHFSRISFLNELKRLSPYQAQMASARLRNLIKERLRVISSDACEAERIEDSLCLED